MDVNKLIGLVSERKTIWREQKNSHFRQEANKLWTEIGQQMGCSGFLARLKWQNLRDTFRRECTKTKRAEAEGRVYIPTWKHYQTLYFLHQLPYTTKSPKSVSTSSSAPPVNPSAVPAPSSQSVTPSLVPISLSAVPALSSKTSVTPSLVPISSSGVGLPVPSTTKAVNPSLAPITLSERTGTSCVASIPSTTVTVTPSLVHITQSKISVNSKLATTTSSHSSQRSWTQPETDPLSDASLAISNVVSLKEETNEGSSHPVKREPDFSWEAPSTNTSSPTQETSTQDDEDYHFLMSLLPHLKEIPKWRKLVVRQKLQNVIIEEQVVR